MTDSIRHRVASRTPPGLRADVIAVVRKQEMHRAHGAKLRKLNVLVFCMLVFVGILLLLPSGRSPLLENARTEEVRSTLAAMKDRARQVHRRDPSLSEITMKDLDCFESDLKGSYFQADDYSCGGTPEMWWAQCENVFSAEPRNLRIECNLRTGETRFNR